MKEKNIIWIASYPKSGNTWIRILLTQYLLKKNEEFHLNNLITEGIASSRNIFEEATGLDSSELTQKEIDNLRPDVYRYISENTQEPIFMKVHDANIMNSLDAHLIPEDITRSVIYIIRNPLDVAVSFAYHSGIDMDKAVAFLCNSEASFCSSVKLLPIQMHQRILSWNEHVKSWTTDDRLKVHLVRYEDLLADTPGTFEKILKSIEQPVDKLRLQKATENSKFDSIKKIEAKFGFRERSIHSKSFFRKGMTGDWRNHLTDNHVKRIKEVNGEMMYKYGYL